MLASGPLVLALIACHVFPMMATILQSRAGGARGTVSSLANVAMYGGTALGVAIAGPLFAATAGFSGVAGLTVCCFLLALLPFRVSGAARTSSA